MNTEDGSKLGREKREEKSLLDEVEVAGKGEEETDVVPTMGSALKHAQPSCEDSINSDDKLQVTELYEAEEECILVESLKKRCVFLAVGKQNSGKSTALNNIFNFEGESSFQDSLSSSSRTVKRNGGKNVVVIDTPGLGQSPQRDYAILTEAVKQVGVADFTLIYCLSVRPGSTIGEGDLTVIERLHWHLGYAVWSKCVLLLTFSDVLIREFSSTGRDMTEYKDQLKKCARQFHGLLHRCGATVPGVKTIHEYQDYSKLMLYDLVAVPVGKSQSMGKDGELDIISGMSGGRKHWTSFALCELQRKSGKQSHRVLPLLRHIREVAVDVSMCSLLVSIGGWSYGLYLDTLSSYSTLDVGSAGKYSLHVFILGKRTQWALLSFSACWLALFPFAFGWIFKKWWTDRRLLKSEREALTRIR